MKIKHIENLQITKTELANLVEPPTSDLNKEIRKKLIENEKEYKRYLHKHQLNNDNYGFPKKVLINGEPKIGKNVYIGEYSEVNAKGSVVEIGDNCDIASFVSINVADSHLRCIGKSKDISRRAIYIGNNVFIGSHTFIGKGTIIGNNTVIGAGLVLIGAQIPAFSKVRPIRHPYHEDNYQPFYVEVDYYNDNVNKWRK